MDYRMLLLIHILAAMAWVGGGFALAATLFVARRTQRPNDADRVMQTLRWADTWLALVAPLLVVVTGVAMVIVAGGWSFSQAWILASIALIVAYEGIALTVGSRLYRRIEDARRHGLVESADHARTMRAWHRLTVMLLAMLVAVVALMVFKPGI
jgi:uncharacterized membrane protein